MQTDRLGRGLMRAVVAMLAAVALLPKAAAGMQVELPVYANDSTLARDGLAELDGLVAADNLAEAARRCQQLLDIELDRVVETADDATLLRSVRAAVHDRLLAEPRLLDRYRLEQEPAAMRDLEAGRIELVEQHRMLTSAGFEATLRVAQQHLEAARFDTALLTLRQLEQHPDRTAAGGRDAAMLAELTARYVQRDDARELATRWLQEAGLEAADAGNVQWPAAASMESATPIETTASFDAGAVPNEPLRSIAIDNPGAVAVERRRGRGITPPPAVFPVAVDGVVYINDGASVTAYDRFTLSPIWRAMPEPTRAAQTRMGRSQVVREPPTLAVAGSVVLATTDEAIGAGSRLPDGRMHAFDRETGRVLWSRDPGEIDPRLNGSLVRGPAVVEGDVAVYTFRLIEERRRTAALFQAGLSIDDGSTRWITSLGSAGSRGAYVGNAASDWSVLDRGVVYRVDALGMATAVEAATGRPKWVRLLPSGTAGGVPRTVSGFAINTPIVRSDSVIFIGPNRDELYRLNADTGEIIASQRAVFDYLVDLGPEADGVIAAVRNGDAQLFTADTIGDNGRWTRAALETPRVFVGRGFAANGTLCVPVSDGLAVFRTDGTSFVVPLVSSGNTVISDGQLLTAQSTALNSYLVWDEAERILRQRIEASPTDPTSALTLAELAYRAGRSDRIVPAIDFALRAAAASADPVAANQRVFEAAQDILESGGRAWLAEGPSPIVGRAEPAITDLATARELLQRMGAIADRPADRVTHLMARGRLAQVDSDVIAAIEAYQGILLEPALAAAWWSDGVLTVTAGVEATRRLRAQLEASGIAAYSGAAQQAEAEVALLAMDPDAGVRLWAETAARYPAAAASVTAWRRAAELAREADRSGDAASLADRGIELIEFLHGLGIEPDADDEAAVVALAWRSLLDEGRGESAARVLETFAARRPGMQPTLDGEPIDIAEAIAAARSTVTGAVRRAQIGSKFGDRVAAVAGERLMLPVLPSLPGSPTDVFVTTTSDRQTVSYHRVRDGDQPDEGDRLVPVWSRPIESTATLLTISSEGVFVALQDALGDRRLALLDPGNGDTRWITPAMTELLATDAGFGIGGPVLVPTPLDGDRSSRDLVIAARGGVAVIASRAGTATAIRLVDGDIMWTARLGMRVFDVTMSESAVAIAGETPGRDAAPGAGGEPALLVLDARDGSVNTRLGNLAGAVRWATFADNGRLIAGLDGAIIAIDPPSPVTVWVADDFSLHRSLGAWPLGERLIVLDSQREVRAALLADGAVAPDALRIGGRLRDTGRVQSAMLGDGSMVLASPLGLAVFDRDGVLRGTDAVDRRGLTPALGERTGLLIETEPLRTTADGLPVHKLHLCSLETAMLTDSQEVVLPGTPTAAIVIDGRAVITAGGSTFTLSIPD
ncbi:MAG: PQQ-binding-like beta-propeller repeat protein [Planctomycetota bacterium]